MILKEKYFWVMKLNFKNWSDFHHQIYRIYHGIIALSLVPFFLVFLELEVASIKETRVPLWGEVVVLMLFISISFYLCWEVWKGSRFDYSEKSDYSLRQKLILFRKVETSKFIWLEIASCIALFGLWLTGHYLFVIVYFAILAQFSFLRPSEDRLVRNMKLTKEEREKLHAESI